jgi:hypothetical protein
MFRPAACESFRRGIGLGTGIFVLWYLFVCFNSLCRLIASTFKWRSESRSKSDFSQNSFVSQYLAKAFSFIFLYPRLKSRGNYLLSQIISRLRHSPLAEGECPKGEGLSKNNIYPVLTLPPAGTSLYQKGRELTHDMSRRDNTLLTIDVNLRTGTDHTLTQVPQGRHLSIAFVGAGSACLFGRFTLRGRANPAPMRAISVAGNHSTNILSLTGQKRVS